MDIKEILDLLNKPAETIIGNLKEKSITVPAWGILKKEYDPKEHPVMDKVKYPDIIEADGTTTEVSRVTFDWQRLAAKRLTELCFGVPPKRVYKIKEGDTLAQEISDVLEAIFERVRINSVNIERGHMLFASCEVMTLWYAVKEKNTYYGIESDYKLRCSSYAPMKGDELYPLFDEEGDLIALSVQYTRKEGSESVTYFDTYSNERHIKWKQEKDWVVVQDEPIKIKKIPAIYLHRDSPAWEDLSNLVYEREWAMSRNGNYLRENSRPLFVVTGDEEIPFGNEPKPNTGDGKNILKYPQGTTAGYVTWNQSIDSLKFHITELKEAFFAQLQLPDWSFERMRAMPMSGESMKQMYIDAILKVTDESGRLIEALDREVSVVKAFLKEIKPEWSDAIDALRVNNVITPCTVDENTDDTDERSGEMINGKQQLSTSQETPRIGFNVNPQ